MQQILVTLLYAYAFILFVRVILSWVPPAQPGTPFYQVTRFLARITDPVLDPIRRALPRTTMIDFSPTIAMVACYILARVLS